VKSHYHHDALGAIITSLEVALVFHAIRFLAGRAATSQNAVIAQIGTATGGAFTFGGHP
jgi:hypothetical protein